MFVSVSRRCDIPRFQFKWFMERVRQGFVDTANPFNSRQIKRVALIPMKDGMKPEEGVDAFVFWTRYPRNILDNADELAECGFPYYVMVSVTGYPNTLEPSMTCTSAVLNVMNKLVRKIGPDRVIWRYDPVILTSITNEEFHQRNFNELAQNLKGSVKRVIVSLYDEYKEAKKRLEAREKFGELQMLDIGDGILKLLAGFSASAETAGMEIQSCAEKEDYSAVGIKPGACIDAALMERLFGITTGRKDKNQRPLCLCCKSVDIGAYGICGAHCLYCYAW